MTNWAPKRFWKTVSVAPVEDGFRILLDDRPVRTPAKADFALPTRALAEAVAAEWEAQDKTLRPETMPLTRAANSAIDKVAPQRTEVAALIAAYGETDLLCYRADGPAELAARQAAGWDPLLAWAEATLSARLQTTAGVTPVTQPAAALAALTARVADYEPWRLAALYDLVAITGSLVLGLAAAEGRITAEEAWTLSRIDEDWQIAQWGSDAEAEAHAANRRRAMLDAVRFLDLLRPGAMIAG